MVNQYFTSKGHVMITQSICYTQKMKMFIEGWTGFEPHESEDKE